MSSILRDTKVSSTNQYKISDFDTFDIHEVKVGETGRTNLGIDRCTEFTITLKVGASFWANQAQYQDALKVAEKVLLQRLHGKLFGIADAIRSAVYSGDAKQILHYAGQIDEELGV